MKFEKKVYIVIVNWNGWRDTLECLESILKNNYTNYQIIICDNASTDNSINEIKKWANSKKNKISINIIQAQNLKKKSSLITKDTLVTIIKTGGNLGFSGGNNTGIKYILNKKEDCFIWLLNNDTTIDRGALTALVEKCQKDPNIGICGSKLINYFDRNIIQACGGARYFKWLGIQKNIGSGFIKKLELTEDYVEKRADYIIGASMLFSSAFFKKIGLLDESYFLYFEELDLAERIKGEYKLGYASKSIVFHKEGSSVNKKTSYLSSYYLSRKL